MRNLRFLKDESGSTVLVLTAVLALVLALLTFSFMIDAPFTQIAYQKAQDALDLGAEEGASRISDYNTPLIKATDTTAAFMSNGSTGSGYGNYSNDLNGNATFRAAVPAFAGACGTADYRAVNAAGATSGLTGSALSAFNSVFDAATGGGCINDYKNGVMLYSRFTPFQFLSIPLITPNLEIEVASSVILTTQLNYVLVSPTFPLGENFTTVFKDLSDTNAGQWPVYQIGYTEGQWGWPTPNGNFQSDPYTGGALNPAVSPQDVYRFYAAACATLPWMLYKTAVVDLLDMMASTSAMNYTTFVGLPGYDDYVGLSTYDPCSGAPAGKCNVYSLVGIHPMATNTTTLVSGHVSGSTNFPLSTTTDPTCSPGPCQNANGLFSSKLDLFNGFMDTNDADPGANRSNYGNPYGFNTQPWHNAGWTEVRGSGWNDWSLRMCADLFEGSGGSIGSSDYAHPLDKTPGGAGGNEDMAMIAHEDANDRRRTPVTGNWADDNFRADPCPQTGSSCDLVVDTDQGRSGLGESVRNAISGLAPRVRDYKIQSVSSGAWSFGSGGIVAPSDNMNPLEAFDPGATYLPASMNLATQLLRQARTNYNQNAPQEYGRLRPVGNNSMNLIVFGFSPWSESTRYMRTHPPGTQTDTDLVADFANQLGFAVCDSTNPVNVFLLFLPMSGSDINNIVLVQQVIQDYQDYYNWNRGQVGTSPTVPQGCNSPPNTMGAVYFMIADWRDPIYTNPTPETKQLSAAYTFVNDFPKATFELLKRYVYVN